MKYQSSLFCLVIGFFIMAACQDSSHKVVKESKMIGMPNPASVYCVQLHGQLIPVSSQQGEYAICTLPSGEKIEEWALFRRNHPIPKE